MQKIIDTERQLDLSRADVWTVINPDYVEEFMIREVQIFTNYLHKYFPNFDPTKEPQTPQDLGLNALYNLYLSRTEQALKTGATDGILSSVIGVDPNPKNC